MKTAEQAKVELRKALERKFGGGDLNEVSKLVAQYTATCVREDRAKRRAAMIPHNPAAEVVDVFFNRRPYRRPLS